MQTRENVYLRDETADDNSGAIFSYYSPTIKGIIAASVVGEPAMMMGNSVSEQLRDEIQRNGLTILRDIVKGKDTLTLRVSKITNKNFGGNTSN